MINFDESKVRDSLERNLSLIENDLKLRKKEEFLPNRLGTRGFIDLTAYDSNDRLVLIEVKKTSSATREAIHELFKYLEGTKSYLGLREDEVRLMVVSIEWAELLVPYSSLSHRVSFQVEGYVLTVDYSGEVTSVEEVKLLPMTLGRFIAPWHELHYYLDKPSLERGLKTFQAFCKSAKIYDYVFLELHPSEGHPKGIISPKQNTMRGVIGEFASLMGQGPIPHQELPLYSHVLYFGMQMLGKEHCIDLLRLSNEDFDEDSIEDDGDDEMDTLCRLHEAITEIEPRPVSDFIEISYPAKLKGRLLEQDGWMLKTVHRYGSFARNSLLTDQTIVDELCGSQGANRQSLSRTFSPTNRTEIEETLSGVKRCLCHNQPWRNQVTRVINELSESRDSRLAQIGISNPSTALLTFYLAVSREDGTSYVPHYHILLGSENNKTLYFGALKFKKKKVSLQDILDQHYEGSTMKMLMHLNWGGYDEKDVDVMQSVGIYYRSFKAEIRFEHKIYYEMTEEGWEEAEIGHPMQEFFDSYGQIPDFLHEVCTLYAERWRDGVVILDGIT